MRQRKVEFAVPAALMPQFTQEVVSKELDNELIGVTDDEAIIVEVRFDHDEADEVEELEEFLDDLIENNQSEE